MARDRILRTVFFLAYGAGMLVLSTFFVSLLGTVSALLLTAPLVAAAAALTTTWAFWTSNSSASRKYRGNRVAVLLAKSIAWAALLFIPVVILLFLPAGHVVKAFEEPGQEFFPWPPAPPSTIFMTLALAGWAAALLLAAMPMLAWARRFVDDGLETRPTARPGLTVARFAVGLATLLASAELVHQALNDQTTRPLGWLWCAGNSNASKVAKLWEHYDRSKPWGVGGEYLIPMDWDVEILDSTRTVRRYYALRLVPRNSATPAHISQADEQTKHPRSLISSIELYAKGTERLPYYRYSESGRFVCRFDQGLNLMGCQDSSVATQVPLKGRRAEVVFRWRSYTGELMGDSNQRPLPGDSYYLPPEAATDHYLAVRCRHADCSLSFIDRGPRPLVTVGFFAENQSEAHSIHAFVVSVLAAFQKAAADYRSSTAERKPEGFCGSLP